MELLTERLELLVDDIKCRNPKSYDYGWQIGVGKTEEIESQLNLDSLTIMVGWYRYLYAFELHSDINYEATH